MSNRNLSFDEAFALAFDHYLDGNIDYNPNEDTTAADLEKALSHFGVKVTGEAWPSPTKGPVTIDGMIVVQGYYDPAVRWNGWLCPSFDRAEAEQIATWATTEDPEYTFFEWDGDVLIYTQLNYEDSEPERYEPDANGRYPIGAFAWVWSAAEDED